MNSQLICADEDGRLSTTNPILQKRIAVMSHGDKDRAQSMYLALVEREAKDPAFAEQQVGYHIKTAKFAAQHCAEKAVIYDRYVSEELQIRDDHLSDLNHESSQVGVFDYLLVADEPSVEAQVEARETARELRAAIETLPANQKQIAHLLLAGFAPYEIAHKLGVSRANISQISDRMFAALREKL